jgi:AcrR family transcriptional regulator
MTASARTLEESVIEPKGNRSMKTAKGSASVAVGSAPEARSTGDGSIREYPRGARSDRVHQAVLTATQELLEEGGLPAATVDAISARSGVSKATIYKHWPSRIAVAAEAFGQVMAEALPLPDTGSTIGDLTEQVRQTSSFFASEPYGTVYAQLFAAGVGDPDGAAYFREYYLYGRRTGFAILWQRAIDRGDVNPEIRFDDATDLLFGPLIFRRISGHYELTDDNAAALTNAALTGLLRSTQFKSV